MTGPTLESIGVDAGAQVRFRRGPGQQWQAGRVTGRERDGSIGLRDGRGRARAIPLAQIEVREDGPRGGRVWTPLADIAARAEQLGLFE